jgi:phage-related protein
MNRSIIFFENHFIELIRQVDQVPEKFLKHLTGNNGLYEILIDYQSNIFRIFCCFDQGKLVVLFNGFQKKTQKTLRKEVEKAEKLMQDYFNNKR